MFEPKTFWEKRAAMMEALILQHITATGMTGLLGPWYQQMEVMKGVLVDDVLGPVTIEAGEAADGEWLGDVIGAQLRSIGLIVDTAAHVNEQGQLKNELEYTIATQMCEARLATLADLEEAIGPNIVTGLYRIAGGDGSWAPVFVLRQSNMVNIFVVDEGGIHPLTLSLDHMPSTFNWDADRKFWRSELFAYRSQVLKGDFDVSFDMVFKSVNFTELNAQLEEAAALTRASAAAAVTVPEVAANEDIVAANDENEAAADPVPAVDPVAEETAVAVEPATDSDTNQA